MDLTCRVTCSHLSQRELVLERERLTDELFNVVRAHGFTTREIKVKK